MVRKILQPFYSLYVAVTFVVSVLIALPFIVLLSIGNNTASRRAIYNVIKLWSKIWLGLIGMPVKVSGYHPPADARYIVVVNHISYLDTLSIFPAVPGYFRPLGKKEIGRIPVLGFIYRQITIMVDRGNAVSRSKSMRLMWRVLKKEGNILIFPEGTFNETGATLKEFYNGAFRLAVTTQTSILPLLLHDTVDRWHYSAWWKLWPGKNRVTFLPPVPVQGMDMKEMEALKQHVFELMGRELERVNGR
ncbi:MAG: 1-acyl-sn-glycerol-3-phosphate acyltransferase [Taibaiella sp.]|nr:1-acyl-sn-glycerol-3-phosphate acyltransferase [Taibaiella sp.]